MERTWTWLMAKGNSELDHHRDRTKAPGFAWAERRCTNTSEEVSWAVTHPGMGREIVVTSGIRKAGKGDGGSCW